MIFYDYTFQTVDDGSIILDEELKAKSLGVVEGDTFVVRIVNNQITLEKQQHGPS
jgi:hypothetical protein